MPVPHDLLASLANAASPDNQLRQQAEAFLRSSAAQAPADFLAVLSTTVAMDPSQLPSQTRSMASLIFKKYSLMTVKEVVAKESVPNGDNTLWSLCPAHIQDAMKDNLIRALANEPDESVRRSLVSLISSLAKNIHLTEAEEGKPTWPALLQALFHGANSPSPVLRKSSFELFSQIPELFGNRIQDYINDIQQLIFSGFGDQFVNVRNAAFASLVSLLAILPRENRDAFAAISPKIPELLRSCASSDDFKAVLENLIQLAEVNPRFLKGVLVDVINIMLAIAAKVEQDSEVRSLALEVIVTFSENAPPMIRKHPALITSSFQVAFQMMMEIEDDPEWHQTTDIDSYDEDDQINIIGEYALDRMATSLGGKVLMKAALSEIPSRIASPEWTHRHAALYAISCMAEGCKKEMEPHLANIVAAVVARVEDPHPRIRYAACNCIGQLSSDFQYSFQEKFHSTALVALIHAMGDSANPRVMAHAASALVNFAEGSEQPIMQPYLHQIVHRLFDMLRVNLVYVQLQALQTLANVAESAQSAINEFYDSIMPVLLNILEMSASEQHAPLRGKAVESVSMIAYTVKAERFRPHADQLLRLLAKIQELPEQTTDYTHLELMAAWGRVCQTVGVDFLPYIQIVLPPLIKAADLEAEFVTLPADANPELQYPESEGWSFVLMDDMWIGSKSSIFNEKALALDTIRTYASTLGASFAQYARDLLPKILPSVEFRLNEDVRTSACGAIPALLESLKNANLDPNELVRLARTSVSSLVKMLDVESDAEVAGIGCLALQEVLAMIKTSFLEETQLDAFATAMAYQIEALKERCTHQLARKKDQECDEEEADTIAEEEELDEDLMYKYMLVMAEVHRLHPNFIGHFTKIKAHLGYFLREDPRTYCKTWAISVWDDIIEHGKASSFNYHQDFLPDMKAALASPEARIRRSAAWGVSMMAQHGGPAYFQFIMEILPWLLDAIPKLPRNTAEEREASDNFTSAIGRITKFTPMDDGASFVAIERFFDGFPVIHDTAEIDFTCSYLLDLAERQHPAVLGAQFAKLPLFMSHVTEAVVAAEAMAPELLNRCAMFIRSVEAHFSAQASGLWAHVSAEKRAALVQKLGL